MKKYVKFIQISDLHLDSDFASSLDMPPEIISVRKSEQRAIITNVCGLANSENVDCILIPGDLIDFESSTPETTNFLIQSFSDINPIPVIITPGNHDRNIRNSYLETYTVILTSVINTSI